MTTTPVTERRKKRLARPSRGQARFAFTVLLIINILNYADRYVLSAVLPQIKHEFNMTDFQGGLLISSFLIVYAVATLPLGVWATIFLRIPLSAHTPKGSLAIAYTNKNDKRSNPPCKSGI